MKSDFPSGDDQSPDQSMCLVIWLYLLSKIILQLLSNLSFLSFLQCHHVNTYEHLNHCLPQREYVLQFLPFEIRDDELVEDA